MTSGGAHTESRWFVAGMLGLLFLAGWCTMSPTLRMDDAFISLRYARNLAAGHGLVYSPGEWVCGATSVLYTTALALLHAVTGCSLLSLAAGLHLLLVPLLGWFARSVLRGVPGGQLGWFAGLFVVTRPWQRDCMGMESMLLLTASLAAILAMQRQRWRWLGVLCTALCLIRPDAVVLSAILFAAVCLAAPAPGTGRWHAPAVTLRWAIAALLPWAVYGLWHFGSIVPSTVAAKLIQAETGMWGTYARELWTRALPENVGAFAVVVVPGVVLAAWRRRRLDVILLAWSVGHSLLFCATRVPGYPWYYAPVLLQSALFAAMALGALSARLGRPWAGAARPAMLTAAALAVAVHWPATMPSIRADALAPRHDRYYHLGTWLARHGPAGTSLGSVEIGILGWYSDLHIVDFCGLVTADVAQRFPTRQNAVFAMQRHRPEFVIARTKPSNLETGLPELLRGGYHLVRTLGDCELHRLAEPDVAGLLERMRPGLQPLATGRVLLSDLPPHLDPAAVERAAALAFPALSFTRDPTDRTVAFVVRRSDAGDMVCAAASDLAPVVFRAEELRTWRRSNVASTELVGSGLRVVATELMPTLVERVGLSGPFTRVRLKVRQESPLPASGALGYLWWTSSSNAAPDLREGVPFVIPGGAGERVLTAELPSRRFPDGEVLEELHFIPCPGPCTVTIEEVVLERR